MRTITQVQALRPYILRITFDDASIREIDVERELYGDVFEPLRDPVLFKEARLDRELGTVVWPNGADFSPEFLSQSGSLLRS